MWNSLGLTGCSVIEPARAGLLMKQPQLETKLVGVVQQKGELSPPISVFRTHMAKFTALKLSLSPSSFGGFQRHG